MSDKSYNDVHKLLDQCTVKLYYVLGNEAKAGIGLLDSTVDAFSWTSESKTMEFVVEHEVKDGIDTVKFKSADDTSRYMNGRNNITLGNPEEQGVNYMLHPLEKIHPDKDILVTISSTVNDMYIPVGVKTDKPTTTGYYDYIHLSRFPGKIYIEVVDNGKNYNTEYCKGENIINGTCKQFCESTDININSLCTKRLESFCTTSNGMEYDDCKQFVKDSKSHKPETRIRSSYIENCFKNIHDSQQSEDDFVSSSDGKHCSCFLTDEFYYSYAVENGLPPSKGIHNYSQCLDSDNSSALTKNIHVYDTYKPSQETPNNSNEQQTLTKKEYSNFNTILFAGGGALFAILLVLAIYFIKK